MLDGMQVRNLEAKFSDAKISLLELLNITDERLVEIGVRFPFQRKRVLYGLLQFHKKKFVKETTWNIPLLNSEQVTIVDAINAITICLKHLNILRCSLHFLQREDIFGSVDDSENPDLKEYISETRSNLEQIIASMNKMIERVKWVSRSS